MSQAPRLVTPEAVVLEFETAGIGARALAMLIDLAIQGTIAVAAAIALIALSSPGQSATAGVVVALVLLTIVFLGYPIAFETLWRGRTPGKAAMGLRVVTTDGAPIRFRHAAVRGFLVLVDLYLTSAAGAVLSMLFSRDDQRLGDLAAGTLVLRERSGARPTRPVSFTVPPGYESYAATLDTAGLGGDDHVAVRAFLLRAPGLASDTRYSLAAQLATTVAARLHHRAPPGLHPEAFLACVAAMHQARGASRVDTVATHRPSPVDGPGEAASVAPPVAGDPGAFPRLPPG